jgi:ribose transport system permease protein
MTFVIISGGIDLSVGSVFALGGVLAGWGVNHGGIPVAVGLPLACGAALGTTHGLLITRARLAPFIVTLAGLLFARGFLQAISKEGSTTYLVPPGSAFLALGRGTWVAFITAVALFGAGAVLLLRTRFGQALFAIGGSEPAAMLMGVPVTRAKTLVYTLSGVLAAGAGMLNAARLQSGVNNIGAGYELTAIAAVIIGGTLLSGGSGSILGTASGVLLLAMILNLIGVHVSEYGSSASDLVNGAFLAVVVLLQTALSGDDGCPDRRPEPGGARRRTGHLEVLRKAVPDDSRHQRLICAGRMVWERRPFAAHKAARAYADNKATTAHPAAS